MDDKEIIKVLECCSNDEVGQCHVCPLNGECNGDVAYLIGLALDLINQRHNEARSEAVREFSKAVIDGIDEGYILHSSDIVDFTHNYLNVKSELKDEALEREQNG